jgi:L,D-peptidoglycan transpeptidase YkuD (ErfK/YbiS/YcfS/YnhG family)
MNSAVRCVNPLQLESGYLSCMVTIVNIFHRAILIFSATICTSHAQTVPDDCRQLVVGISNGWDDSHTTLTFYQRKAGGAWKADGPSWPARLGRDGLAWGRGLHTVPRDPGAGTKREGDMRAPAGMFEIGGVWGYEPSVKRHPKMPYRQITTRDLWIEDPKSPHYNRHVQLPHEPRAEWEKKGQMRQNDHAHSLKVFIAHNAEPNIVAGAGSSIFFHIWRADGGRASAGCTTMSEEKLRAMVARLDPTKRPVFVLLPKLEYAQLRESWRLP